MARLAYRATGGLSHRPVKLMNLVSNQIRVWKKPVAMQRNDY
jgi:hypothetical protein